MKTRFEMIVELLSQYDEIDFNAINEEYDYLQEDYVETNYTVIYYKEGNEYNLDDIINFIESDYPELYENELKDKLAEIEKTYQKYKTQYIEDLKRIFDREQYQVLANIVNVSNDGMIREMRFAVASVSNGKLKMDYITYKMAYILDMQLTSADSLVAYGAGMDMIFATLYNLSDILYGNGYVVSKYTTI